MHIPLLWCYDQYKKYWSNKIKIEEKSYKNILTYCIEHVTVKDLIYVKINSVNPLYLIINKINEYIEESNEINIWR